MRALLIPALFLALPACTPARPLPPARVRNLVEAEVRTWHRDHHQDCPEFIRTRVDYQGDVRSGHTEIWTVDACGRIYRYQARVDADLGYNITVSSLD